MGINGIFAPILNQGLKIILSMVLMLGVMEILLLLVAKFVASKKHWSKRKAILIAQLIWLLFAYQVIMHGFQQLGSIGQVQTRASESNAVTAEEASSPEAAINSYINNYQQGDFAGVVLTDAICYQRALRQSAVAPTHLQQEEFKQAVLGEVQRIQDNHRKRSESGMFVGHSDDQRIYGSPLYSILYPGMQYQILEIRHSLFPTIEGIVEMRYADPINAPFYKPSPQDMERKVRRMIVFVAISEVTDAHRTVYKIYSYRLADLKSAPTEYF